MTSSLLCVLPKLLTASSMEGVITTPLCFLINDETLSTLLLYSVLKPRTPPFSSSPDGWHSTPSSCLSTSRFTYSHKIKEIVKNLSCDFSGNRDPFWGPLSSKKGVLQDVFLYVCKRWWRGICSIFCQIHFKHTVGPIDAREEVLKDVENQPLFD